MTSAQNATSAAPPCRRKADTVADGLLFLYKIQPVRPEMLIEGATPDEEVLIGQHFDYLKRLIEAGVVFLAGRTLNTDPASFGIVIFHAVDEAAARQVMHADPAVRGRVMRAELYPFRVALLGNLPEA